MQKIQNTYKEAAARRRIPDEVKEYRKQQKQLERELYLQSEEYKLKQEKNREAARQRRIAYNKSDAHRQSAIESNKRRWKDGCPEKTRQKMSESARKSNPRGKYCWVSKNNDRLYIEKIYLEKYLEDGWHRGRK